MTNGALWKSLPVKLIDSHVHLQDPVFHPDFALVLERAAAVGVDRMICNATSEKDWQKVLDLSERRPRLTPCLGVHPWYLSDHRSGWELRLERLLLQHPKAGVGEIGLDRWNQDRDEKLQEVFFRNQLDIARRLKRPAMIHCLRAWGWLLDVLESEPPLPAGFLIHAYGGSREMLPHLADRGAYFSFAGNVLNPRKSRMRRSLSAVPRDRLLLETDSPDLPPPQEFRVESESEMGGACRNQPANLRLILKGIAELLGESEESFAQSIWQNSVRFLQPLDLRIRSSET